MPEAIDDKDLAFIEKRRRMVRWWNLVGSATLAGLAAFVAWMFHAHPKIINPLHVAGELEAGSIDRSMLELMAFMLPVIVLTMFVVLGAMFGFAFTMISNERRYLKVIDRLRRDYRID